MASSDLLHTLLISHLINDDTIVYHLPFILSSLSSQNVENSPNLSKWTNRVNALIHARDSGARWAGLCLALETSRHSRNFMMGSAQTWVTVVLPTLSQKAESLAVWKAAMKLLYFLFTSTVELSEFQRQVATPNVPKFSTALVSLAEKQTDEELRALCLDMLSNIVPLYPTLHRQLHPSLSSLSLKLLDGSAFTIPSRIIASACKLHACLNVTGGKVGAAALWRKSLDETIGYCGVALAGLRIPFSTNGQSAKEGSTVADALQSVSLHLHRLRCGIELIRSLLCYPVTRPVLVPVNSLVDLSVDILKSTAIEEVLSDTDPSTRSIENSVVPRMLEFGCRLLSCLSRCVQHNLTPHLTRILSVTTYRLEQRTPISQRLPFVRLLPSLLDYCLPPSEPLLVGRILKALLPTLASLLRQRRPENEKTALQDPGSKKGKKRARGYEGDEVFKVGPEILCRNKEEDDMILAVLDVLPALLRVPNLPAYLQSISSRVLLSILIALHEQSASTISHHPTLKGEILKRVESSCAQLAAGTSSVLSKNLPLVIDAISKGDEQSPEIALLLDLMLHPRLPPLLRSLPSLDAIALSLAEEGKDERETRQNLLLRAGIDDSMHIDEPQSVPTASLPTHALTTSQTQTGPETLTTSIGNGVSSHTLSIPFVDAKTPAAIVQPIPQPSTREISSSPRSPSKNAVSSERPRPEPLPVVLEDPAPIIAELDKISPLPPTSSTRQEPSTTTGSDETAAVAMSVDEEDDGDIVVPPLNMDSDSEAED